MAVQRYRLKQYDLEPAFEVQLLDGDTPVDLTSVVEALFIMSSRKGLKVSAPMMIPDQNLLKGVVRYSWQTGDTDTAGTFNAEVQVTWPTGRPQTFPANQYVLIEIQKDLNKRGYDDPGLPTVGGNGLLRGGGDLTFEGDGTGVEVVTGSFTVSGGGDLTFAGTDTPATPPDLSVDHGSQIGFSNTGYTAYWDEDLGRALALADLVTVEGDVNLSDVLDGATEVTGRRFTGVVTVDTPATFNGCLFEAAPVTGFDGLTHTSGWTLNYCTVAPAEPADECLNYQGYTAARCLLMGSSDGAKANGGGTVLRECLIRVASQGPGDHNDGVQNVGGAGDVTVERCNIDVSGVATANAALFFADAPTAGVVRIVDNYLAGGGYTLRLHDALDGSGLSYVVTGNRIGVGTSTFGPVNVDNNNPGAFTSWSDNALSDGTPIEAP